MSLQRKGGSDWIRLFVVWGKVQKIRREGMFIDPLRPDARPVISRDGHYVFMPLTGNGEFGGWSLAKLFWFFGMKVLVAIRPLSYEETCTLCDAAEHYMFYWLRTENGAVMMCVPYDDDVRGTPTPYPLQKGAGGSGGALV